MTLPQAIEVAEEMERECKNEPDAFGSKKMVYNAPAIFSYERNYKEALTTLIDTCKRIDVERIFNVVRYRCTQEKCDRTCPVFESKDCGIRKLAQAIYNMLIAG